MAWLDLDSELAELFGDVRSIDPDENISKGGSISNLLPPKPRAIEDRLRWARNSRIRDAELRVKVEIPTTLSPVCCIRCRREQLAGQRFWDHQRRCR